jgi:Tol biopolymer transport system component
MYFSADAEDGFHIWQQRFPGGRPEQITSGPTEEEGLAIAPDGRSLITSVGIQQRSVWIHDAAGERQLSLEGYAFFPLLSADGQKVCFRITRGVGSGQSPSELWMVDLGSGQKQRLFPGQLVIGYDLSNDDRVAAAVSEQDGRTAIWLTRLDGREPPRRIPHADGDNPRFGRGGEILFRVPEGNTAALYRISENGDHREKITPVSGAVFGTVSPDGEWLSSIGVNNATVALLSMSGRSPLLFLPYSQTSRLRWTRDGRRAYVSLQYGAATAFLLGRTYLLPPAPESALPDIPPGGFQTEAQIAALPGVVMLPYGDLAFGSSPDVYAFSRITTTRNLYRIPIR